MCSTCKLFLVEILLSVEAMHPFTGKSVPIIVSPGVPNLPYTPDNEHLGMGERERENEQYYLSIRLTLILQIVLNVSY